jgi:hypothetical protein
VATVLDLLDELGSRRVVRAAALASALHVSKQTLSRLVARAGDQVCRIGSTRATQYARTRSIEGLGRTVPVFRVSEAGDVSPDGQLRLLWEGQTCWEREEGSTLFTGLPPALVDMAPQGYMGHGFADRFPELGLPSRLTDWSDDHRLIALARRGEDCVGDLIVGDESLERHVAIPRLSGDPASFPDLAREASMLVAGSSAAGERPKFGVLSRGRHVLVKFASPARGPAARRWSDLLWCEWKALQTISDAGVPAARPSWHDIGGWRFLELERFDRVGERGRRAVLTLGALDNEYFGGANGWTAALPHLRKAPFRLPDVDVARIAWLDTFGQLIANTDRHLGNLAFFVDGAGRLRLTPAYDMLPMALAPTGEVVRRRDPRPVPPTGSTLEVWPDAAKWAIRYWTDLRDHLALDEDVRAFAGRSIAAIEAVAARVTPTKFATAPWRSKAEGLPNTGAGTGAGRRREVVRYDSVLAGSIRAAAAAGAKAPTTAESEGMATPSAGSQGGKAKKVLGRKGKSGRSRSAS